MMDRDDIPVGVGGEGVISPNGTIIGHVGGYLPIIDQVKLSLFLSFHLHLKFGSMNCVDKSLKEVIETRISVQRCV